MRDGYETRIKTDFKKLASFFLFWILLSSVSFANKCPLQEFRQYVDKLDKSKIESVNRLKDNYKKTISKQSPQCRSMLFGSFRHYYDQMTQAHITSVEEKLNEKYPLSPKEEKRYKTELEKVGLRLDQSEGMYYVEADSAWFLKEFGAGLTDAWTKYFKQWNYETINYFSEDGVMLISFEELRKRVVFWESFLNDYPDFPEGNNVHETLSNYLSFYLSGLYSTLNFSHIPISSTDIRKSYENFLKLNTQSKYYEVVKSQYNIIKDNAFVIDEKVSKKLDINYKKIETEVKKKAINKIKSEYKYVHDSNLYQTKIVENANDLPAPGVGNYSAVTNFSFEWTGGEPYILRFVTKSHIHAAKTYYEEYLFDKKGELLFALSVDEYKISTRYYFDNKRLLQVIKDQKIYDVMMISKQMKQNAAEIVKESRVLSTMFTYISNY
ncbi:hypothetical protein ACLHDG_08690 [Sulfurovum sp. CS9]|uniref:hypothetical protein n=1 Tax=Sulfurovum sp. CS9 TaxID=3391146 RepID=UPI0039EA5EF2